MIDRKATLTSSSLSSYYAESLTPDTVAEVWDFAEDEHMLEVKQHCRTYMARHFRAYCCHPSFLSTPRERLRAVLESGMVCVCVIFDCSLYLSLSVTHTSLSQIEMDTDDLVEALLRWGRNNISASVTCSLIADLLPPSVLFNTKNRRYLLQGGEPILGL